MSDPIHISLTKVARLPDRPEGSLMTETETLAISTGYTIKGFAPEPPEVGKRFYVDRYERNGDRIQGAFSTSLVARIYADAEGRLTFDTQNSTYRLTQLPPATIEDTFNLPRGSWAAHVESTQSEA